MMKKIFLLLTAMSFCVVVQGMAADPVEDAIAKPGRLDADLERDARSRPDVVLPLLQLVPGDRVADIWAGSGYYSELVANIVGESGEVLLVNNLAYSQFAAKGLAARQDGRQIDTDDFIGQIHTALKPGGRFLIVDHYASEGSGKASAQELHRIDVDFANSLA